MKLLKTTIAFTLFLSIVACGGGGGDDTIEPVINDPTSATLVFPQADSECTEGSSVSDTESTVTFKWGSAMHADSYGLLLKNLNTGNSTTFTSNNPTLPIKIKRGTPYSWHIISKSKTSTKTATSATWKFYNAGAASSSYAPFPAELLSPLNNTNITPTDNLIALDWAGSDVDNDIESYTLYLGETNTPSVHQAAISESIVENITVVSGKTYYWKVDTKDVTGNISTSDLFKFTIN